MKSKNKVGQTITPHLWFDKEAKEAAEFYTSIFPESRVTHTTVLRDTPSGDTEVVSFELWGHRFQAISAGPLFKFNPAISFMVNFDPSQDDKARERIEAVWQKLAEGGKPLMEIGKYPFSERYGWIQDKYGLSWQLILTNPQGEKRPPIIPSLLFVGDVYGKAEEAINFYLSVFRNSPYSRARGETKMGARVAYGPDQPPDQEGATMFADFELLGEWFTAMDSAHQHKFVFNEAISLMVSCEDQQEIDYYWEKLSAVPEAEQCGWLKDKYGIVWQIVPTMMDEMMKEMDEAQKARVTQAFLKMKKLDLAALRRAYETSDRGR